MTHRPAFLLLLAVLAAAASSGCAPKHENIVHVIAEQAPGLKRDARVQFRGVDVGYVKEVYFTPGGVRIDALIEHPDVPIRTQDSVHITSAGPFGEQVVSIVPGVQTAPLITQGVTLPKAVPDTTISVPVEVWRSVVRSLSFATDSGARDTGVVIITRDSTPRDSTPPPTRH
jgi:ABC-type transporter Mla subunit MlaD